MDILNSIWLSELISLNCSEISAYEKKNFELKNVKNDLDILLKKNLKIRNNRFYKIFFPKN